MDFRVADIFTTSLARLTAQEQKSASAAAFSLHLGPSGSGFSFHKLDRAADKNLWSARVNSDLRIIVHRLPESLLLAFVAHHNHAYHWGAPQAGAPSDNGRDAARRNPPTRTRK